MTFIADIIESVDSIPYSLKFSRLKIFAVFADYGYTMKILSREIFTYIYVHTSAIPFVGVTILPVRARSTAIDVIAYRVHASAYRL